MNPHFSIKAHKIPIIRETMLTMVNNGWLFFIDNDHAESLSLYIWRPVELFILLAELRYKCMPPNQWYPVVYHVSQDDSLRT